MCVFLNATLLTDFRNLCIVFEGSGDLTLQNITYLDRHLVESSVTNTEKAWGAEGERHSYL